MKITVEGKEFGGQSLVKDYYRAKFPWDDIVEDINPGITFQDVYEGLEVGTEIYALLGAVDSIVRERVFDALADLMECSYDHIYYKWLDDSTAGNQPLKGVLYDDLKGLRFTRTSLDKQELLDEAKKVSDTYAEFDEESSEQLLEDAMNLISRFVEFVKA